MKKLFIFFAVLLLTSGCDSTETKNLSCSNTTNQNGVTTKTKYDFEYQDDEIKYVTITYDYTRNTTDNKRDIDGTNADTDGLDEDKTTKNNDELSSDDVVDGVVGDAIDETVDTVTDTILDIAGIKSNAEKEMSNFDNIEGFSYEIEEDNNDQYKVIYKIDMEKISDDDLARFDIDRKLATSRTNYEDLGYTCK